MSRRKNTHHDEFLADAKRRRLINGSDDSNETIGTSSASTHQSDHASELSHMQGAVNLGQVVFGLPFDQEATSVNSGLALEVLSPSLYLDPCDFGRQSGDGAPTGYEIAPGTGGDSQSVTSISRQMDMSEIVCFGMVCGLSATYENKSQEELPLSFLVHLDSQCRFIADKHEAVKGSIDTDHLPVIEGLLEEQSLKLHITCVADRSYVPKKKCRLVPILPCSLNIAVYGPLELFDALGEWFQDCGIYLQDPDSCHQDTKYCNPQRMSSADFSLCPMVSSVISKSFVMTPKELPEPSDFMDILSSYVDLEETPQPSAIRAVLQRHQKQALTFMLEREKGWGYDQEYPDIWKAVETGGKRLFVNTVSGICYPQEPPQFYGGIIADPMGLGKTLTMISLVAMDMEKGIDICPLFEDIPANNQDIGSTLVIVPPPILGAWEDQLHDHIEQGALHYRLHYGKSRLKSLEEIDTVNLVLTTYHTVLAEWKSDGGKRESPLFSVRWRRIILDEGHFIRNANCKMAVAVCALEAISRWVVTGTPIQNRLGDLASLLKFIRVHPYADPKRFEADISGLWRSGEAEEAVKRLQKLSACLLLRRAKSTINLPPRRDIVYTIDFSAEERAAYDQIKQQTIVRINEALGQESGTRKSRGYVNVLQQIESLRLFCNLGLYYDSRHDKPSSQYPESEEWNRMAQRTFNYQRVMSSVSCLQCASALGLTDTLLDDTSPKVGKAQYTSCLRYICSDCVDKLSLVGQNLACGHTPPCYSTSVSTSSIALEEIENSVSPQLRTAAVAPPSKVRSLVDDIKLYPPDVKCIVFSTWRLSLDLAKAVLDQEGIPSIRFDGKVPQKDRQSVVARFESDPQVRVMLLTLTCGAVGLTLTAASRAYLMEPHWNPTLEEQALARIHRLGQTKPVTTIRLYMRDSFEEQVRNVQDSKKQLAGVLLSPHDSGYTDDSLGALERLRSLL